VSHQSVDVDLLVDDTVAVGPPPPPRSRGRVGIAVLAVAAVVVALLAWPDASTPEAGPAEGEVAQLPVPDDPRLLPWPARGPYASDEDFLAQATEAWRTQASVVSPADVPGGEAYGLWAGTIGKNAVALLQAVGEDGLLRVAQVSESRRPPDVQPGPLVLTAVEAVTTPPEMLGVVYAGGLDLGYVLDEPGRDVMQVLPAPGLLAEEGVELQRHEYGRFAPLVMQPDGLSQPWVHDPRRFPEGAVVVAVRVRGADPGILAAGLLVPGQVVPGPTPVQLVTPEWGRTSRSTPDNYVDALAALAALGRSAGQVAVLGTAPLSGSRAALLEVRPDGPGSPVVVTVHAAGVRQTVSGPQPARPPTEIALGTVRLAGGPLVVVGAGPPDTDLLVYGADGRPVGTGPRVSAIVLPADEAVSQLAVQGYRPDETFVGRSVLTLGEG